MSEMKAALAEIDDVEAVQAVRDLAMELHATVAILRCRKEEVNRCYEKIESYRNEIADLRQQLNTARGMIPPQEPEPIADESPARNELSFECNGWSRCFFDVENVRLTYRLGH